MNLLHAIKHADKRSGFPERVRQIHALNTHTRRHARPSTDVLWHDLLGGIKFMNIRLSEIINQSRRYKYDLC